MEREIGDLVIVKSKEWYNLNKDFNGNVACGEYYFPAYMRKYLGKKIKITSKLNFFKCYLCDNNDNLYWTDKMFENNQIKQ